MKSGSDLNVLGNPAIVLTMSSNILQIFIAESGSLVRLRCDLPSTKFWHETNGITWRKLTRDDSSFSTKEHDRMTRKGWNVEKINAKRAALQQNLTPAFANNGSKSSYSALTMF